MQFCIASSVPFGDLRCQMAYWPEEVVSADTSPIQTLHETLGSDRLKLIITFTFGPSPFESGFPLGPFWGPEVRR